MTILRVITDINVEGPYPTEEEIDKVQELFRQFGNGVIPMVLLTDKETSSYVTTHTHESTRRLSCSICMEAAQDERS